MESISRISKQRGHTRKFSRDAPKTVKDGRSRVFGRLSGKPASCRSELARRAHDDTLLSDSDPHFSVRRLIPDGRARQSSTRTPSLAQLRRAHACCSFSSTLLLLRIPTQERSRLTKRKIRSGCRMRRNAS